MANIHLGKSPFNKKKGLVNIEIFFHVPNPREDNKFPGVSESLAPGTTAAELTALQEGILIEVPVKKKYNLEMGKPAIKTAIRGLWQGVADKKLAQLDKDYRFYGTKFEKAV